jgi:hypothetical protein
MLQLYSEYSPTGFDSKGLNLDDQQNWLVIPCILSRDSDCLETSNHVQSLEILGGESDNVEVHRFGHWACGWFEIIIINPGHGLTLNLAKQIDQSLEDYIILNEEHYSELEYETMSNYWSDMPLSEKVELCQECEVSIFMARSNQIPDYTRDPGSAISEKLREYQF